MVQKNSNTRLPRSANTVVEFEILSVPKKSHASKNKSDIKGVYWNKRDKNWRVKFTKGSVITRLGSFKEKDVAETIAINYYAAHPWGVTQSRRFSAPVRNSSCKYKGVCLNRKLLKWKVAIVSNKKNLHLGYFTDEKQAAMAYDQKALELWGDEAYTNQMAFPEDFDGCDRV